MMRKHTRGRHSGDVVTDLTLDGDRLLHDVRSGGTDVGYLLGGVEDAAGHDEDGYEHTHRNNHLRQGERSPDGHGWLT